MNKLSEMASLYKAQPVFDEKSVVAGSAFTDMILQTKNAASAAFDKLAYLAGIKNAPEDSKYQDLDKTSLASLLRSARNAGYDVDVVSI